MRSKKRLIISIVIMLVMGLFAIFFAFSKALQPTKAQWYSYQVKNYIGDMQVNESKRIDWIHGSEVIKFANMKLDKPFYKVSSDGYITVNVVEF